MGTQQESGGREASERRVHSEGALGAEHATDMGQGWRAECCERAKRARTEAMARGGSEQSLRDQAERPKRAS